MRRRASLFLVALVALGLPPRPCVAAPRPALRILFVGNSLTSFNDLPGIVTALAVAAGEQPPFCRAIIHGGYSLEDHWIQGDARKAIEEGGWDFVVLQQGPSASEDGRDGLAQYAWRFAPSIKKAGATTALYMVWPPAAESRAFGAVSDSYRLAAKRVGGIFIPAGEAWRIARMNSPEIPLYRSDGFHPTATGSYLAALVLVGRLYERSPIGWPTTLGLPSGEKLEVAPDQAKVLQEAAAEAIAKFAQTAGP